MADASLTVPRAGALRPISERAFGVAFLGFAASMYLLPSGPAYADVFYVLVAPLALLHLWRRGLPDLRTPGAALALALIVWSGLTLVWGHDDKHRTARFALDTVATGLFLLAMLALLPEARMRERLRTVLIAAGSATAALAILLFFTRPQLGARLTGWGLTSNAILGANAIAVPYLAALWRGLSGRGRRIWLDLAAALLMAVFVLLTESRGPLLAGSLATLAVCAWGPWRVRALLGFAVIAAGWYALPAKVHQHQAAVLVARGTSHRLDIWGETWRRIAERPLFGHGLASNLGVPEATFPHDLYLSVLFYSGAVGFLLFAAMILAVLWRAWARRRATEFPFAAGLLIMGLAAGLTDLGQITKGPGPMWVILWLPLGIALTFGRECDRFVARDGDRS